MATGRCFDVIESKRPSRGRLAVDLELRTPEALMLSTEASGLPPEPRGLGPESSGRTGSTSCASRPRWCGGCWSTSAGLGSPRSAAASRWRWRGDADLVTAAPEEADILTIDRLLNDLQELDPQQARIVELRFFAGLTVEETAEALGISKATVKRDWAVAKAWMTIEMGREHRER